MPGHRRSAHLVVRTVTAWVMLFGVGCDTTALIDASPSIGSSTTLLNFGDVAVGDQATRALTLRSVGSAPLTVHAVHIAPPHCFEVVATELDLGLHLDTETELAVRFAPSEAGMALAVLTIESDAVNTPRLQITLRGNGTSAAACGDGELCQHHASAVACTDGELCDRGTSTAACSEGEPCDDGDPLTEGDTCRAGRCAGEPLGPRPAELLGVARTFGATYGDAATLPGSRLLVMDREGKSWDGLYRMTLVQVQGGSAQVLSQGPLVEGHDARGLVAAGPARAVGFLSSSDWQVHGIYTLQVYSIDADDTVRVRGQVTIPHRLTSRGQSSLGRKGAASASAFVGCLESGIVSVDLRDPDAPAVRSVLSDGCDGVVLGRDAALAYVGNGEGVVRYALAQDASLTRVDELLSSTPGRLLGDSTRGLVYAGTSGLLLINRESLQTLPIQGAVDGALTMVGDRVLAWSGGPRLQLWDISSSSQAELVAEVMDLHNQDLLAADTSAIVLRRTWLGGGMVILSPDQVQGGRPALLRHPAQGVVGRLVAHGAGVLALDRTAARGVSVDDPRRPVLARGGPLPQEVDAVRLGVGSSVATHIVGWNHTDPLSARLLEGRYTRWIEVSDVGDATEAARMSDEFESGTWYTSGDGRDVVMGAFLSDFLGLRTLGLASSGDALVDPGTPGATLLVPLAPAWDCAGSTYLSGSLTLSPDQRRAVLAINRVGCTLPGRLAVFDVSDRAAPRLLAQHAGVALTHSARIAGDRVLVSGGVGERAIDGYLADTVRLLALDGAGGMVERAFTASIPPVLGHLLSFDGERAYIAEQDGLMVVEVSDSALPVRYRVATPEPPISALIVDPYIVLSGASGVYVVRRPIE